MLTLTHVEDYLELIAGLRDTKTGKLNSSSLSYLLMFTDPIISLARYDVSVLDNMVTSISNNVGLTERQAQLACRIILKYRRQLQKLEIDVTPVENPVYRIPLRSMDYSCRIELINDHIHVRFPFDDERITQIREFSKISQGSVRWSREDRHWVAQLSEFNVNWLVSWAKIEGFDISPELLAMFEMITDTELSDSRPLELRLQPDDSLMISDAPDSLMQYVAQNLPPMHLDNALTIIDHCAELGVTVHDQLLLAVIEQYPDSTQTFWDLLLHREAKANEHYLLEEIYDYADRLQRWPVVLYEPDLSDNLLKWLQERYPGDVIKSGHQELDSATKYIYTRKPIKHIQKIPLLISKAGMTFGADKLSMIQRCSKVVYFAPQVYRNTGAPVTEVKQLGS